MKKITLIAAAVMLTCTAFAQTTPPAEASEAKEQNTVSTTATQTALSGQDKGQAVSTVAKTKAQGSKATGETSQEKVNSQQDLKLEKATAKKNTASTEATAETASGKETHGQEVKAVAQETEAGIEKGQVVRVAARNNTGTAKSQEVSGAKKARSNQAARASQAQGARSNAAGRPAQANRPVNR